MLKNTMKLTEKEQHNAAIKERYRKLFDAVEDQITPTQEEDVATTYTPVAPSYVETYTRQTTPVETYARESTPVVEQAPEVKEYVPSPLAEALFTTEKYEKLADYYGRGGFAPVEEQEPVVVEPQVVEKATTVTATATTAQYSLTPMAKLAMALFAVVFVAMLVLIGFNTRTIEQQTMQLNALETQKQELVQTRGEIQERIRQLQTEESILERAQAAGLID